MVTLEKVKSGIVEYVDTEFISKMHDARKWLVGAGVVMLHPYIDNMYAQHKDTLVSLGFANEDDTINVDKIYNTFREQAMRTGPVVQAIPIIGEVKFSVDDIDKLYRLIGK